MRSDIGANSGAGLELLPEMVTWFQEAGNYLRTASTTRKEMNTDFNSDVPVIDAERAIKGTRN